MSLDVLSPLFFVFCVFLLVQKNRLFCSNLSLNPGLSFPFLCSSKDLNISNGTYLKSYVFWPICFLLSYLIFWRQGSLRVAQVLLEVSLEI